MPSEQYLNSNSTGGGGYQVTLATNVSAPLHADMEVQSCLIWTALTDVYLQIDATATSTTASCLLPANALIALPYENLNQINLISATGGAINVIYRNR